MSSTHQATTLTEQLVVAPDMIKSKKARKGAKKPVAPKKKGRTSTAASPAPVRQRNRARSDYAPTEDEDDPNDE